MIHPLLVLLKIQTIKPKTENQNTKVKIFLLQQFLNHLHMQQYLNKCNNHNIQIFLSIIINSCHTVFLTINLIHNLSNHLFKRTHTYTIHLINLFQQPPPLTKKLLVKLVNGFSYMNQNNPQHHMYHSQIDDMQNQEYMKNVYNNNTQGTFQNFTLGNGSLQQQTSTTSGQMQVGQKENSTTSNSNTQTPSNNYNKTQVSFFFFFFFFL